MAVVEVGVGWNMAVVGDSRGNTMGVGCREDSMAVGCGEDSMAVGCGEDSLAVGGGEDSRVDNSGISFSFSLLHNMLKFTILGYITGDTQSLTKRSGVSSVVVRSLIVADNLSRSGHGMSGIAGDWESRVRVGGDNWSKWCLVGHRVVDQGSASSVGGGKDSRVEKSWVSFSFSLLHNMLEFTILGYITGDTQSLSKRSGVSSVVVRSLIVADTLSRSSHRMSGIAGDREGRVGDNWGTTGADYRGSVC